MNLKGSRLGKGGLDGSGSGQEQVAGCYECGNEPSGSMKCGEFVSFSRSALVHEVS